MVNRIIKRISVFAVIVCLLMASIPLFSFAVDPVSTATMANALAQAITAYGASQGVSMTYDVTSTDGIGEGVHELWDQFVTDVNDPNTPTYDSLAVTMWSNLYSKIGNNLGINISASEMPFIDSFWNWLLSGPAEMTKVDNQYYEWTVVNDTVEPISVYSVRTVSLNGVPLAELPASWEVSDYSFHNIGASPSSPLPVYVFTAFYGSTIRTIFLSEYAATYQTYKIYSDGHRGNIANKSFSPPTFGGLYFSSSTTSSSGYSSSDVDGIPAFDTVATSTEGILTEVYGVQSTDSVSILADGTSLTLVPYVGDSVPQDVYIPDNEDVNYQPVDVAIPLDIPWDNTLFGDGSGVLTDAQSAAASAAADDAITDSVDKTLIIADTDNPSVPAPGEVYVPFLPISLPNFNFNLSGIWHYVRDWVSSLGAWFTTLFAIWNSLPYSMVIPVYATAVVVIVLGVYKRFFM